MFSNKFMDKRSLDILKDIGLFLKHTHITNSQFLTEFMALEKKLLYKRILQLQNFAGCWLSYCVNRFPDTSVFELERSWTDDNGNLQKSITYVLSDDNFKVNLSDFGLYCTTLTKLSDSSIKNLIRACNEFGIPCKPYEKK